MSNWPEKVYLRTNPDAFDQGLPENNDFQGTMWTWLHDKEKAYSVKYIRSDLALPDGLKAELQCCKELMEELLEYVEPPPDKNCTCFISPPCSDCVDYAHLREIIELSRAAIERLNGVK